MVVLSSVLKLILPGVRCIQQADAYRQCGPHIKVRFFGGWDYTKDMLDDKDWVKRMLRAYPWELIRHQQSPKPRPLWFGR